MDLLQWIEVVAVVLAAICLVALIALFVRRRLLSSAGGVFDCGLRSWKGGEPGGWAMGLVKYRGNKLAWYRTFSLMPGPALTLDRSEITISGHRPVNDIEANNLFYDHLVVSLESTPAQPKRELSMTSDSLMGLMSWKESAPPGGSSYRERP